MYQDHHFPLRLFEEDQRAEHLDTSARRSAAYGYAAQEEHPDRREHRPIVVVDTRESTIGGHRNQIECHVAQRSQVTSVGTLHPHVKRHPHATDENQPDYPAGFGISRVRAEAQTSHCEKVRRKVERGDHHENDENRLDRGRIEVADACVMRRKTAQRQRRERVANSVEERHSCDHEEDDAGGGDTGIHEPHTLAVCVIRGVSFVSFIGPGVSAR